MKTYECRVLGQFLSSAYFKNDPETVFEQLARLEEDTKFAICFNDDSSNEDMIQLVVLDKDNDEIFIENCDISTNLNFLHVFSECIRNILDIDPNANPDLAAVADTFDHIDRTLLIEYRYSDRYENDLKAYKAHMAIQKHLKEIYQTFNESDDEKPTSRPKPQILDEFRRKTEMLFHMPGYTVQSIESDICRSVENLLNRTDIDFELGETLIYGSRSRGCHLPESNLNILIEILTDCGEDTIDSILATEIIKIGNIPVKITPLCIKRDECLLFYNHAFLRSYLEGAEEYMRTAFSNDSRGKNANYESIMSMVDRMHFERMINTTDNWCPNYPDNKFELEIALFPPEDDDDSYNVQIWAHGADDLCVSLIAENLDHGGAEHQFLHWKHYIYDRVPEGATIEWFLEHGFGYD